MNTKYQKNEMYLRTDDTVTVNYGVVEILYIDDVQIVVGTPMYEICHIVSSEENWLTVTEQRIDEIIANGKLFKHELK